MRPSRSAAIVAVCSWSRPWIVDDHGLGARLDPLHRPPGEARGLCDRELLGVDVDLRAEAAADVGRDHAHLRLRDAADRGHERAHEVRHLRRGVERELVARRDPVGHDARAARSDRREALVVDRQRDLDGRGVEDGVEALGLVLDRAAVIARAPRRAICARSGLAGVLGVDHDRQRLVVDDDAVGGVARGRLRVGDDERDGLADHAHLALGQDRPLRLHGVAERIRGARHAALEPEVRGRQHLDDARHGLGRGGVDAADDGVRVRRARERGEGHAGQLDVIDVAALAGDQRPRPPCAGRTRRCRSSSRWPSRYPFAALSTALTMFWYPVQRQRLPSRPRRTSRSLGSGFCSSR